MFLRYKIFMCFALLFCSMLVYSQNKSMHGQVVDENDNPVAGALVYSKSNPQNCVTTNKNGKFSITVTEGKQIEIKCFNSNTLIADFEPNSDLIFILNQTTNVIDLGYGIQQKAKESTGSVSIVGKEKLNSHSAYNIANSLYGNALGLTSMQKSGAIWEQNPKFNIRGLQTLSNNNILIVVDGIQRDINYIVPEEVESVSILRDASAVALYGYKGINGVLSITTKRGKYDSREIKVSYDHGIKMQNRIPEMVNSYTYANAVNEALINDGLNIRYNENEIKAFKNNNHPYLYPNINWHDEVFKKYASSDICNVSFQGGSKKVHYYTLLNLQNDEGFFDNTNLNDGYSTQEKYSQGNIRTNLDIEITPTTQAQFNIMGVLNEFTRPGLGGDNLIEKIYNIPSAAFPIKTEDGLWGGNSIWNGQNPVALSQARGYSKGHIKSMFADLKLTQNLDEILNGLEASVRLSFDNTAAYWEGHNKTFAYGSDKVVSWNGEEPNEVVRYKAGNETDLNFSEKLDWQKRRFDFIANLNYNKKLGEGVLTSSFIYSYDHANFNNRNHTYYHQNFSLYNHYIYKEKYMVDLIGVCSGSNNFAPNAKYGFSPTIGAGWLVSEEDWFDNKYVNYLKLRGSFGIINSAETPDGNYWEQNFVSGGSYNLGNNYGSYGGKKEGRIFSDSKKREKANKYNVGIDAILLANISFNTDFFYEQRRNIWVSSTGTNSSILGNDSPYVPEGKVNSWGFETGLNYQKSFRNYKVFLGGNFALAKNEIKDQCEEPKAYSYLEHTGKSVNQIFGYEAVGFFKDENDIINSPVQQFSEVKPGDIKYKDQNNDGIINSYDQIAMGYNNSVPEIYYSFNFGIEFKGLGVNALFQGVDHYSAILNTSSLYWPLYNNKNISEHYYNNRWTPENTNAKYPRLTSEGSDNNFRTNSIWVADASFLKLRNCEIYYKIPQSITSKVKIDRAKFYVRGVDLVSFDNIDLLDPESIGLSHPMTRSINIGLTINL